MNKQQTPQKEISELEKIDCKTSHLLGKIHRPKGSYNGGHRRILAPEGCNASYHVMSRTVGGEFLLATEEKEALKKLIWKMAAFLGVKVATYCVMDNHFHILVRVPAREKFVRKFQQQKDEYLPEPETIEDKEGNSSVIVDLAAWELRLLKHLKTFYTKSYLQKLTQEIQQMRLHGHEEQISEMLDRYTKRFCSIQHYTKEVKERFSRWFNKKHGRRGTLWMDRYKSVLVEDGLALRTMAAYIDLNPVRAGICDDPAEYRWCGYAEAESGSKRARAGLCGIMNTAMNSWEKNGYYYRCYLFDTGKEVVDLEGNIIKKGANQQKLDSSTPIALLAYGLSTSDKSKQKIKSVAALLRTKIKYLSYGLIFGSAIFQKQSE